MSASQPAKVAEVASRPRDAAVIYPRVLLKLSGEALMGDDAYGINRATIEAMVADVSEVSKLGVEVAIVIGGLAQMYVTIIGGQAWPLDLFPGFAARSSFFDGEIHPYAPSLVETLLGLGGFAIAALIVIIALKVLRLLPDKLDNATLDPHHSR